MPRHLMINHMQLHFVPVRPACVYEFMEGLGEKTINCDLPDSFPSFRPHKNSPSAEIP